MPLFLGRGFLVLGLCVGGKSLLVSMDCLYRFKGWIRLFFSTNMYVPFAESSKKE